VNTRNGRRAFVAASSCAATLCLAPGLPAQSYSLDAAGYQRAEPAAELLVLRGQGESADRRVSGEAWVWAGARNELDGDVVVADVQLQDQRRHAELTLGRFVVDLGALRPVHLDGASARIRLPEALSVEAIGGLLVVPGFDERSYDWVAGGRFSRALGDWGSAGIAYGQRSDHGELSARELGLDAGAAPSSWLDLAGRLTCSLVSPGVSEARANAVAHHDGQSAGLFYVRRSPFRLLPATSLFSVLGDSPAQTGGASFDARLAPRLDLSATAGLRWIGSRPGESLRLATLLRLDDLGQGSLGVEGRRESAPDGNWTGVRPFARVPIADRVRASTELELVVPDHPRGRGRMWPWCRVSLAWTPAAAWEMAAAVEASASPQDRRRTDALLRVTHHFEGGT
jgi:hypothetical protein